MKLKLIDIIRAEILCFIVNHHPKYKNLKVPEDLHDKVFASIREYEANKNNKDLPCS